MPPGLGLAMERTAEEALGAQEAGESGWARRIAAGDVDALGEVYAAHGPRLHAYLRSLGASAALAEDVLHEVFLRLIVKRAAAGRVRNWPAFLFTVTRREFYRWSRRLERRRERSDENIRAAFEVPGTPLFDEREEVALALARLPLHQREVVIMKIYGGLTFEEVGKTMDTSPNTAASRYRYAMEKLRESLG